MNQVVTVIFASLLALTLAACSTTEKDAAMDQAGDVIGNDNAQSGGITGDDPFATDDGAAASGTAAEGGLEGDSMGGDRSLESGPLSKRVVYFEFDSSDISPEFSSVLQAHGEFLATHPEVSITVEGNTDERGSREYNLALGERRARAVKQILTLNGAAGDQIETVSFGEEQPAVNGHDEAAWAENRRAELVYPR